MKSKLSILAVITLITVFSCAKSEVEPQPPTAPEVAIKLVKITKLDTKTGIETVNLELFYDALGKVSSATSQDGLHTFTPIYNSNGQLTTVKRVSGGGVTSDYTLEYNAIGHLIKKTVVQTRPAGFPNSTLVTSYINDSSGKPIKIDESDIKWDGENMVELVNNSVNPPLIWKDYVYDTKRNPYYDVKDFLFSCNLLTMRPSKNNSLNHMFRDANGVVENYVYAYEYNSSNYPASLKIVSPASTVITKYYYAP